MPKVTVTALAPLPQHLGRLIGAAALLCLTGGVARGVEIGPEPIQVKIAGVPVTVRAAARIDIASDNDAVHAKVDATGDLADLQSKALVIARALPLPSDNCAKHGTNLVVDRVDAASIKSGADTAVVDVAGHVTVWACGTLFGAVVKTKVASDTIELSAPVRLAILGPHELGLKLAGSPTVTTGNKATSEAARALFGDLNAKLATSLTSFLDTNTATANLASIDGLKFAVEHADFVAHGATLGVRIAGTADATGAALNAIYEHRGKQ